MGKTHRRTRLDGNYGCFDGYYERSHHSSFVLNILGRAKDIEYEKAFWNKRHRDGVSGYIHRDGTTSREFYRKLSRKNIRNGTRQALQRGIADGDWDNIVFPDDSDGKKFIWSVW
jgi:hypothetical protein